MLTPIFPMIPDGRPGFRLISAHVSPPSVDLKRPLAGPPLDSDHGVRNTSQMAAKRTFGFWGSIARSTAPAELVRKSTLFQVCPPSLDRKTPRSSFGPYGWPSAAT